MSILIELQLCKGCGICESLCPKGILSINPVGKVEVLLEENCTQCRQCEQHCPDYAIFIENGKEGVLYA